MSGLWHAVRSGSYHDSIVLMQLQAALADLPGIVNAAAVMAVSENLALLEASDLLPVADVEAGPSDLLIVVRAESETDAERALARVDEVLSRRAERTGDQEGGYPPRSLATARAGMPAAQWALVAVPGRYAARVAREALSRGLHVFLYSDNVSIDEEIALKRQAASLGLLVMGPDCGTAIINGVGLGFANRVRRGSIGLVGASGTGMQAVASHIHALGGGVSHAIGTGGRDLDTRVGGITFGQGLDLLARDPRTDVIVIVSKPPAPSVARSVLGAAAGAGKPIVVHFPGFPPPARRIGSVRFSVDLSEAARMAVELSGSEEHGAAPRSPPRPDDGARGFVRGLFAGGTLALESLLALRSFLHPLHSNLVAPGVEPLRDVSRSEGHTILDLGADEFTVGRPHPMLDNELRLRRLAQEAADPRVDLILLDVVLGDGAHPDPARELAPAIAEARRQRDVEFAAVVIGTDEDPQDLRLQVQALTDAGAGVFEDLSGALGHTVERIVGIVQPPSQLVELSALTAPVAAINVGLESFAISLVNQGAEAVHVDWRPPAGGDERLLSILDKLRR